MWLSWNFKSIYTIATKYRCYELANIGKIENTANEINLGDYWWKYNSSFKDEN